MVTYTDNSLLPCPCFWACCHVNRATRSKVQTYVSEGIDEHLSHSCSIEWSCIYVVLTRVLRYLCFLLYFSVMFLGTLSKSKSFEVTIVLLFAIFFFLQMV